LIYLFIGGTGVGIQGFTLARWVLYSLSHAPNAIYLLIFIYLFLKGKAGESIEKCEVGD
jgi:hypothetical protein